MSNSILRRVHSMRHVVRFAHQEARSAPRMDWCMKCTRDIIDPARLWLKPVRLEPVER